MPARLVAKNRSRHPEKVSVAVPIDGFKLTCERFVSRHHLNDAPDAPVCLATHRARGHSGTLAQARGLTCCRSPSPAKHKLSRPDRVLPLSLRVADHGGQRRPATDESLF